MGGAGWGGAYGRKSLNRRERGELPRRTRRKTARASHDSSEVVIIRTAVGIAQLAEHRTVAPTVAGSIPVSHPKTSSLAALHAALIHCQKLDPELKSEK